MKFNDFLLLVFIVICLVLCYVGVECAIESPKREARLESAILGQDLESLKENPYVSARMSKLLSSLEHNQTISRIRAVSEEKGVDARLYRIEITLTNGKKYYSWNISYSEMTPWSFSAYRANDETAGFIFKTDGREYKFKPDALYFSDLFKIIRSGYYEINDQSAIDDQWKDGIQQATQSSD